MLRPLVNFRAIMPENSRNRYIDDFFNDTYRRMVGSQNVDHEGITVPSANIQTADSGYLIEIAAPGFKREEFKIEIDQNILNISGERKVSTSDAEASKYSRKEFNYLTFNRSFTLPETAEEDKISAIYEDGILKVMIPVKDTVEEEAPRKIMVS